MPFRAVHKAIHRLRTDKTRKEHGDADQRGGIIWHTQGSGKKKTDCKCPAKPILFPVIFYPDFLK
ncbi:MAG: hypothetical protein J7K30_15030 [Deltaproteobacteria bacterium]|nr:hypothetical protein [Deltaproteobacteria bacterium]